MQGISCPGEKLLGLRKDLQKDCGPVGCDSVAFCVISDVSKVLCALKGKWSK